MKYWVIKKENQVEIIGYSEHPAHLEAEGWEVVCEAPSMNKDIIDLVDVVDEQTKKVTGKRAVVNESKRQAKEAKKIADEAKARGEMQAQAQAIALREEKIEAMWEYLANGNMAKINAIKAKK